jgi:hypothetical protein
MSSRTFDPSQFQIIFGGKIISGFADGSFITMRRNDQAFNLKVGTDGKGTRVKSNNRSGQVQFNLMQSSPSNDDLSAIAQADELTNAGVNPLYIKDGTGTTIAAAVTAWIQKLPDTEFSNEATQRQWIIETDNLELYVGGNTSD